MFTIGMWLLVCFSLLIYLGDWQKLSDTAKLIRVIGVIAGAILCIASLATKVTILTWRYLP